jgi:hypothetical protein
MMGLSLDVVSESCKRDCSFNTHPSAAVFEAAFVLITTCDKLKTLQNL